MTIKAERSHRPIENALQISSDLTHKLEHLNTKIDVKIKHLDELQNSKEKCENMIKENINAENARKTFASIEQQILNTEHSIQVSKNQHQT